MTSSGAVKINGWNWKPEDILRVAFTVAVNASECLTHNTWENMQATLGFKPKAHPTAELHGKVCIVTGANAGIGRATSEALAGMGAHVILACRNKDRGQEAAQAITRAVSPTCADTNTGKVEVMQLDLSSLDSVHRFVDTFNARGLPLHLLVCNAGIMSPLERMTSADGLELQFQANFLSHLLLANGLLAEQRKRRKQSTQSIKNPPVTSHSSLKPSQPFGLEEHGTRVVLLSSCTHIAGRLQWHDMLSERHYSPFISYTFSKLTNIIAAKELQRRFDRNPGYGADSAVSVHPGVVNTHLAQGFFRTQGSAWSVHTGPLASLLESVYRAVLRVVLPPIIRTTTAASRTVLYAALAPSDKVAGQYVVPDMSIGHPDEVAEDEARALQLWDLASRWSWTTDPSMK